MRGQGKDRNIYFTLTMKKLKTWTKHHFEKFTKNQTEIREIKHNPFRIQRKLIFEYGYYIATTRLVIFDFVISYLAHKFTIKTFFLRKTRISFLRIFRCYELNHYRKVNGIMRN